MQKSHSSSKSTIVNKNNYFFKNSSQKSLASKTRALSSSKISNKSSQKQIDNGVKLTNSYYNDRQQVYLDRSRNLSESSINYQTKNIGYSKLKSYDQKKIEKVIQCRSSTEVEHIRSQTMSLPLMKLANKDMIRNRIESLNVRKVSQLISGSKSIQQNMNLLKKEISEKLKTQVQGKWKSPFKNNDDYKSRFEGKQIISKKIPNMATNSNKNELKVLNFDRLFRMKDGKLGNIIPLPVSKINSVTSRNNVMKTIKKKDIIHLVIEEYNQLLKISKTKKTTNKLGIRGKNFTKPPTLEELMGIKIHEFQKKTASENEEEFIDDETFFGHCNFYLKHMKKNIHLGRRLLAGLKQNKKLDLEAFTRFYSIFVNKVATMEEKVKFLVFFFIPLGQDRIDFEVLKLILEIMCEELPVMTSIRAEYEYLSDEEKSKIFYQALTKVLFEDILSETNSNCKNLTRQKLEGSLVRNEDGIGLLLQLLMID